MIPGAIVCDRCALGDGGCAKVNAISLSPSNIELHFIFIFCTLLCAYIGIFSIPN